MTRKSKGKWPFSTYGLTHIALAVKDVKLSVEFYAKIFGTETMYFKEEWAQIQTPGSNDIIVFEKNLKLAGKTGGGIMHFGFRLVNAGDIDKVKEAIEMAKGKIIDQGEFVPGEPYIFFKDPDGYDVEVWFEKLD